jgi:hypothetical protein
MMRLRIAMCVLCVAVSGCATLPATGVTPYLPPGVYGIYEDNDLGAINQSAWALASAARIRNDPVDAAKAVIAVEFLAAELQSNPRWAGMSVNVTSEMERAQVELRQVVGIRPDAPPQIVINSLLEVADALSAGNESAALQALGNSAFARPPAQTLAILTNLPYVPSANYATMAATREELPGGGPAR